MCWVCASKKRSNLTESLNGEAVASVHFGRSGEAQEALKLTTAFPGPDGVGDLRPTAPIAPGAFVNITDEAGDGIGDAPGNPVLTVGAPSTLGTIQINGDQDYYQVTLVAGQAYEIGMYTFAGSIPPTPLPDAFIELYDEAGNFITSADGGAMTTVNKANSGFDVLLTFTAEASGTFYINARAFDNDPTDGNTGEGVGDYEIFVRPATATSYQPYYDLDSPLHALDWGSQINKIHQSARNPDGNEGPRNTGNAQGTPEIYDGPNQAPTTGNPGGFPNAPSFYDDPLVDSDGDGNGIGDGNQITFTVPGKNVITVYYAKQGEAYKFDDPSQPGLTEIVPARGLATFEIVSMRNALASYAEVADIVYIELDEAYVAADPINPNLGMRAYADLTILTYNGTPGTGLLGRHSPPDEGNEGQGEYNALGPGWNAQGLAPGGFSFVTIIHELGHAHGLAHPHDNGGRSSVLRGVEEEGVAFDYTTGDFDLNQAINTIMSYEDGWPMSPYGNASTTAGFGFQTGLSAFDIAVIQDKYGVNEDYRAGNDVYILPEVNAVATFNPDGSLATKATGYSTLWDAGGVDEIRYDGGRNATIDLREATLKYEVGGGGWVSFTTGANPVFAGFTIANGAVIENATSGSGNDTLVGNAAANRLDGGLGDDMFRLDIGGDDIALGGSGNDGFYFGKAFTAADLVDGGGGSDQVALQGNYNLALGSLTNISGVETLVLLAGNDTRFGDTAGNSYTYVVTAANGNVAPGGIMTINANALRAGESFTFNGAAEIDGAFTLFAGLGTDNFTGGAGNDGFFFGEGGRFAATDQINGGVGNEDQIGLRGDYSALVTLTDATFQNVETIVLTGREDFRYGNLGFDARYNLKLADGNTANGTTLTVTGNGLGADDWMRIDGSSETNAVLRLIGGSGGDTLTGGALGDTLFGGEGADILSGGGGLNTFLYRSYLESSSGAADQIAGFLQGDKIDLSAIDAILGGSDDGFTFIGSGAFTGNSAGNLRAFGAGANWTIEADVDGNGLADFVIEVVLANPADSIVASDFVL